jgi:AraC family transcriptional activator of pyochelin receptor
VTLTISREDYDQLWKEHNPTIVLPCDTGCSEIQLTVPRQLGDGLINVVQLNHLEVTISQYQFHQDVFILEVPSPSATIGEIGFNLSGNRAGKRTGETFIEWGTWEGCDPWVNATYADQPITKVDIHINYTHRIADLILEILQEVPAEVRRHLEDCNDHCFDEVNVISPAMRLPLEQILHCAYKGRTKQLFLESKCLELITLKLDQLNESRHSPSLMCPLKPDDIERVNQAKDLLYRNLNNPPTLLELAHRVNLNDYKLKIGFRQVFGTTVFGYLHRLRMEEARMLLGEQRMNVKEVASHVGYASQSRFASAFRKQFGINPKAYFLSRTSG